MAKAHGLCTFFCAESFASSHVQPGHALSVAQTLLATAVYLEPLWEQCISGKMIWTAFFHVAEAQGSWFLLNRGTGSTSRSVGGALDDGLERIPV